MSHCPYRITTGYLTANGNRYVMVETPNGRVSVAHSVIRKEGDHFACMHVAVVFPGEMMIEFTHGGGA